MKRDKIKNSIIKFKDNNINNEYYLDSCNDIKTKENDNKNDESNDDNNKRNDDKINIKMIIVIVIVIVIKITIMIMIVKKIKLIEVIKIV